jgi:hypothetical protein
MKHRGLITDSNGFRGGMNVHGDDGQFHTNKTPTVTQPRTSIVAGGGGGSGSGAEGGASVKSSSGCVGGGGALAAETTQDRRFAESCKIQKFKKRAAAKG